MGSDRAKGHIDTGWIDPEYEEYIVVDEEGLRRLREALEELPQKREILFGEDIEGFLGIKLVPKEWFKIQEESPTLKEKIVASTIGLVLVLTFLIGFGQIVRWIIDLIVP